MVAAKRDTLAVILGYQEPGWLDRTIGCALDAGLPILVVPRFKGIGPMSGRFHEGNKEAITLGYRYAWNLTNVGFVPEMYERLFTLMEAGPHIAAIHPSFDSDHPHMNAAWNEREPVPFVEWTAPFVRLDAYVKVGPLDDTMGYWGFDLDWSHRAKKAGYKLCVSTNQSLEHVYLRDVSKGEHDITTARRRERAKVDSKTENRLIEKWGEDWLKVLWPSHPDAGKKTRLH